MVKILKMISNYNNSSRNGNSIKYIVMHYTGNKGDTAKNNAVYFNGGDRNASANYFVDDTEIYQVVEDARASWNCGDGKGKYGITNQNSISIEMCCDSNGNISTQTENNALDLVKHLQKKYNISNNNVVRHYDASRKICPNWSSDNWERWNKFKEKLSNNYIEIKEEEVNYSMYVFSKNWYLSKYSDVAKSDYKNNPYSHYEKYGKNEGRLALPPIPTEFCEGDYLELNSDIKVAISKGAFSSGIDHYLQYGFAENRKICKTDSNATIKARLKELEIKMQEIKKIVE